MLPVKVYALPSQYHSYPVNPLFPFRGVFPSKIKETPLSLIFQETPLPPLFKEIFEQYEPLPVDAVVVPPFPPEPPFIVELFIIFTVYPEYPLKLIE